ncbi:hypothetical protein C0J52_05702 [Blattella germanica]|nr:hypothetical protein C0J52_05702 [Blattella germanica]
MTNIQNPKEQRYMNEIITKVVFFPKIMVMINLDVQKKPLSLVSFSQQYETNFTQTLLSSAVNAHKSAVTISLATEISKWRSNLLLFCSIRTQADAYVMVIFLEQLIEAITPHDPEQRAYIGYEQPEASHFFPPSNLYLNITYITAGRHTVKVLRAIISCTLLVLLPDVSSTTTEDLFGGDVHSPRLAFKEYNASEDVLHSRGQNDCQKNHQWPNSPEDFNDNT